MNYKLNPKYNMFYHISVNSPRRLKVGTSLVLSLSIGIGALAQNSSIDEEEQVFTLSPFTVEGTTNEGYRATTTLAGTRIATNLDDVGSAISVLTKEFLEDIGAVDNETALAYALNTEVGGARGNFLGAGAEYGGANTNEDSMFENPNGNNRIRGLGAADNTRNYFLTNIPWDGYITNRVDIQRGPNAMLFGLGNPAGVVNASTITANFAQKKGEFRVNIDQFGSRRFSVDYNLPVVEDQFSVRVAVLNDSQKYRRDPAFEDDERYYFTAKYAPGFLNGDSTRTDFTASYESGSVESNRPRFLTPEDRVTPFFRSVEDYGTNGLVVDITDDDSRQNEYGNRDLNVQNAGEPGPMLYLNAGSSPLDNVFIPNFIRNRSPSRANGTVGNVNVFGYYNVQRIGGRNDFISSNINDPSVINEEVARWSRVGRTTNENISDTGVFDFYNNMFEGDSKREFRDWDVLDLEFSNTLLDDRIGFNVAYHKEQLDFSRYAFLGFNNNQIQIDFEATLPDIDVVTVSDTEGEYVEAVATPNPNVGRAFVQHQLSNGTSANFTERESLRAQVFGEYDFRSSGNEGFLQRILGKHRVTGLFESQQSRSDRRSYTPAAFGPEFYAAVYPNRRMDQNDARLGVRIYVSDDLRGKSVDELNISRVEGNVFDMLGTESTVRYFDLTWTADPAIANDPWTDPNGSVRTQEANPSNYAGWTTRTFPIYSILDPDAIVSGTSQGDMRAIDYLTKDSGSLNAEEIDSKVFVWQGYFWDDSIVGAYGYRQDEYASYQLFDKRKAAGGPYNRPSEGADLNPEIYNYNMPDIWDDGNPATSTENWSVAVHLNKLLGERDFLPFRASFYYNRGENTSPDTTRTNIYAQNISPASGQTRDASFLIGTKDGKYSLRVTDYKTVAVDSNASATLGAEFLFQQALLYPAIREGQFQEWENSGGTAGIDPSLREDPLDANGNARDFNGTVRPAWRAFAQEMESRYGDFINRMFVDGTFTNANENTTFTNHLSSVDLTEDSISEGTEFEFVANPTGNWRIMLNASKTNVIRSDVGGVQFREVVDFMDNAYSNTDVGLMAFAESSIDDTVFSQRWAYWRSGYLNVKALDGLSQPEIREWRANLITNYSFDDGKFNGFSLGGAYRYEDPVILGYDIGTIENGGALADGSDSATNVDLPIYGDSENSVDFWITYKRALSDRVDWKIQLNLYNAFGNNELIPISVEPDGTSREWRIKEGTSWMLSNTFSF